jgi:hypothetical protein
VLEQHAIDERSEWRTFADKVCTPLCGACVLMDGSNHTAMGTWIFIKVLVCAFIKSVCGPSPCSWSPTGVLLKSALLVRTKLWVLSKGSRFILLLRVLI